LKDARFVFSASTAVGCGTPTELASSSPDHWWAMSQSRDLNRFGEVSTNQRGPAGWPVVHPAPEDKGNHTGKKAFRILIADDHEAVRRGLRSALIGAGWVVCGEAFDGKDAIRKTAELKPDLVILDVSMPNLGGLDAAREILKARGGAKILVFTMHESRQIREEAAAIGVHGLAVKSAPLSTLLATIDSLLIGTH
jgi:CheY-like chemotaxis protein